MKLTQGVQLLICIWEVRDSNFAGTGSILRLSVFFSSSYKQMLRQYLKLGYDRHLKHALHYTLDYRPFIRRREV